MKIIKSMNPVFLFLAILFFFAIIGCDGDSGLNNQVEEVDFDSGEFAVFDFDDAIDQIQDATLETDFTINPDLFNGHFFRDGGLFGRRGPRGPFGLRGLRARVGNHLGKILRELNLSEEQRVQVREFMSGFRNCIQEPLQAFREANQDIIDATNEERRAILELLQSGTITRDEAKELLKSLNKSTRAAILNNPQSEAARQAMCDCKLTLFSNVRAILDEEQRATWDDWVAGLEGFCFKD